MATAQASCLYASRVHREWGRVGSEEGVLTSGWGPEET